MANFLCHSAASAYVKALSFTWLSVETRATTKARLPGAFILIFTHHAASTKHTSLTTPASVVLSLISLKLTT